MLVTLGTNAPIGAGASQTFPYACKSVQKIFIKVDDSTGTQAFDHYITVQLGSRTIVNGAYSWGLLGMTGLSANIAPSTSENSYEIDLGSHQLLDNENLYVTVRASNALDAVDVSALVDEPVGEYPVRYTEFSDNVFTAENVLTALSFRASRGEVDEDAGNIEIRTAVNSSSPNLISCNNWYSGSTQSLSLRQYFGLLCKLQMPLSTTFNYPGTVNTDRVIVASLMGTNQRAISQGKNQAAIARSQVGQ